MDHPLSCYLSYSVKKIILYLKDVTFLIPLVQQNNTDSKSSGDDPDSPQGLWTIFSVGILQGQIRRECKSGPLGNTEPVSGALS